MSVGGLPWIIESAILLPSGSISFIQWLTSIFISTNTSENSEFGRSKLDRIAALAKETTPVTRATQNNEREEQPVHIHVSKILLLSTLSGAWFGSIVLPLDWGTYWQLFPIPCVWIAFIANCLCVIGFITLEVTSRLHCRIAALLCQQRKSNQLFATNPIEKTENGTCFHISLFDWALHHERVESNNIFDT